MQSMHQATSIAVPVLGVLVAMCSYAFIRVVIVDWIEALVSQQLSELGSIQNSFSAIGIVSLLMNCIRLPFGFMSIPHIVLQEDQNFAACVYAHTSGRTVCRVLGRFTE